MQYSGEEVIVRTEYGETEWILRHLVSSYLFNLYAGHIIKKFRFKGGVKICERNINTLRYTD